MATTPHSTEPGSDLRSWFSRTDRVQADFGRKPAGADRTQQATRRALHTLTSTGLGAGAPIVAAGAAFAKPFIN